MRFSFMQIWIISKLHCDVGSKSKKIHLDNQHSSLMSSEGIDGMKDQISATNERYSLVTIQPLQRHRKKWAKEVVRVEWHSGHTLWLCKRDQWSEGKGDSYKLAEATPTECLQRSSQNRETENQAEASRTGRKETRQRLCLLDSKTKL